MIQFQDSVISAREEGRTYTNPHVRFVRIRGRIVPIVNKGRVGQDLGQAGSGAMAASAGVIGLGLIKRALSKRLPAPSVEALASIAARKRARAAFRVADHVMVRTPSSILRSAVKTGMAGAFKAAWAGAKLGLRHPVKTGLGIGAVGMIAKTVGTRFEASSTYGKDFNLWSAE